MHIYIYIGPRLPKRRWLHGLLLRDDDGLEARALRVLRAGGNGPFGEGVVAIATALDRGLGAP